NDEVKTESLNRTLAELQEERNSLYMKWKSEKEIVDQIQKLKVDIEQYKWEANEQERQGNYGRVAELRYGLIKTAENKIEDLQEELKELQVSGALIDEEVDSEDIADVLSRWTGIPVTKMMQSEK